MGSHAIGQRIAAIVLSLLSIAAVPPHQIAWRQSAAPTVAQSYIYRLYITQESGLSSVVTLTNTLCGTVNGLTECSTALPAAANPAIITGNQSQLSATDPMTKVESILSVPFIGDQGCIFRDNLYPIGRRVTQATNKQGLNNLLNEFKAAKFKHISTTAKGNNISVTEECIGYIVQS